MPKVTAIDQRLAASSHKLQVVRIDAADSAALTVQAAMRTHVERAKALVRVAARYPGAKTQSYLEGVSRDLGREFSAMMDAGQASYESSQRTLCQLGYDWSAQMLIKNIPRQWFVSKHPEVILFGRDQREELIDAREKLLGRVFTIAKQLFGRYVTPAIRVEAFAEPAADDEISDEEWADYAKEVIFPPLSEDKIGELVNDEQWGKTFPGNTSKFNDPAFASQLTDGISSGENVEQLTGRIRDLEDGVYWKARRTARTESLRVMEAAQREGFAELGDMMRGIQVLAVLDQNTRPEHALRNGTIYADEPGDGELPMDELPMLPDEPNCRCWSVPVLTAPEEFASDPSLTAMFSNDSGVNVPDPAAYDDWFAGANERQQKLAVGAARYNAVDRMLQGMRPPEWTDFVNPQGALLSRHELQRENQTERSARKQAVGVVIRQREALIREIAAKGFIGPRRAGRGRRAD